MALKRAKGCILTPDGWMRGAVVFNVATGRIEEIVGDAVSTPEEGEARVLPGFVDLHVHGGGGADVMDGDDAIDTIARLHGRFGTTSLLATTVTALPAELERVLGAVKQAMDKRRPGAARVLGVHLEGPFISEERLGAHVSCTRAGLMHDVMALHALAPIRVLTLAPEVAGHMALIRALRQRGILPQIGHSNGTYEDGVAALEAGAAGFTHLLNAMSGFHQRKPGMVGAALAHADYAEIIPDLLHVHPGAVWAAMRAVPRLYCVTDATAGAGMPDGDYHLGAQKVCKCLGAVRLADGTLAGSVLTMDQALRNLVHMGVPLAEAALRVSTYPADYLGESERGRLCPHAYADMVVLDAALQVRQVYVEGEALLP